MANISWRSAMVSVLLGYLGVMGQIRDAHAWTVFFTLPPACDKANTTGALGSCDEFLPKTDTLLSSRNKEAHTIAERTDIDIDWELSTAKTLPGLQGSKIGPTCDLEQPLAACAEKDHSIHYKLSGKSIKANVDPVNSKSGRLQAAAMNGLLYAARACYIKQVVDEAKRSGTRITSQACLDASKDVAVLSQRTKAGSKTYLKLAGVSVRSVNDQKLQRNSPIDVGELCKEDTAINDGKGNRQEVSRRLASCYLKSASEATHAAYAAVLDCEVGARTEVALNTLTFGGANSIIEKRIKADMNASDNVKRAKDYANKAKSAARHFHKSKATQYGKKAAGQLNKTGDENWNSIVAIKNEYFAAPDCFDPSGTSGDTTSIAGRGPSSDFSTGGAGDDDDGRDIDADNGVGEGTLPDDGESP